MRTGNLAERRLLAAAVLAGLGASATIIHFTGTATPSPGVPVSAASDTAAPAAAGGAPPASCPADPLYPKRQLRGVWIATVRNIDWPSKPGLTPQRQRAEYLRILDNAAKRRFNAVFVQLRPASDALYASPYEPWSHWLSGKPGKSPGWDPLPFLIAEAHRRGMEFHAWFNPYRAAPDDKTAKLPRTHPARLNPSWTVRREGNLYYNPGLPQVRNHITKIVKDVVSRYDVDGVHFDDYFYPYPGKGTKFDDDAAYARYGQGKTRAAWRRDNVNRLIAQVSATVRRTKERVKFGVSPFGIWRNASTDPTGSDTRGMQSYDDIHADSRTWIRRGWIDYVVPQLYWPRGLKIANYAKLLPWWANEVKGTPVHLYIGQALYRVGATDSPAWTRPGELPAHLTLGRKHPEVRGDVYFSARQLAGNPLGVLDLLTRDHYARPALLPLMTPRGGAAPAAPTGTRIEGGRLTWTGSAGARSYAVYRVPGEVGEPGCALTDASNLLAVVPETTYTDGSADPARKYTYFVTALDPLQHESAPASPGSR
ncbi:glycoside hydrolase family 10 protein [Rhizohabitans arisaemae]|uniref:glycoside hydrolase family 10 protein n=1 Tax=Rhizohabitans arisaemae TaxID=2720610 RepID=UPI0024B1DB5C|nr:family 10 glycosylhydrolase [Rhizohabitans arisaemae]